MRILVWILGLTCFLVCTTSAYFFFPTPRGALAEAGGETSGLDGAPPTAAGAERVATALSAAKDIVTAERDRIAAIVGGLDLARLRDVIRRHEMSADARETDQRGELRAELDLLLSTTPDLEFLIWFGADGQVLAAGAEARDDDTGQGEDLSRRVGAIVEVLLRERELRSGLEWLPTELLRVWSAAGDVGARTGLRFCAATIVATRPDFVSGAVLAGSPIGPFITSLGDVERQSGDVRVELFAVDEQHNAAAVRGDSSRFGVLRPAFIDEIERLGSTTKAPFVDGGDVLANWIGVPSIRGRFSAVLGVVALPPIPATSRAASSEDAYAALIAGRDWLAEFVQRKDVWIVTASVLAGLLLVWFALKTWSRRVDAVPIGMSGFEVLGPLNRSEATAIQQLRRRLEAVPLETKRLLAEEIAERTREMESSVGAELAKMRSDFESVRRSLASHRDELTTLVEGLPGAAGDDERLGGKLESLQTALEKIESSLRPEAAIGEDDSTGRLRAIEASLAELAVSLGRRAEEPTPVLALVDERLRSLESRLSSSGRDPFPGVPYPGGADASDGIPAEWREEAARLRSEIDSARTRTQELIAKLEGARSVELELRGELEELRAREADLADRLAEEISSRGANGARSGVLESRVAELEASLELARAESRQRMEELDRREAAAAAPDLLDALRSEKDALEVELEALRREAFALREERDARAVESARLEARVREVGAEAEGKASAHSRELEQLRREVDEVQDFQGALLQGNLPLAFLAVDSASTIIVFNPAAETLLGVAGADALGTRLDALDLGSREFLQRLVARAERTLAHASSLVDEPSAFEFGDRNLWLTLRCEPIVTSDDRCVGAIISIEDSTKERLLHAQAEEQENFLESLARSIPVALVVTDNDRRVIVWNSGAERILKLTEDDALGRDLLDLRCRLYESSFREEFRSAEREGRATRFQILAETEEVQAKYLVTFSPFRALDGKPCGHVLLIERAAHTKVVSRQEG
jgi:PAS domain S-box-containing protein